MSTTEAAEIAGCRSCGSAALTTFLSLGDLPCSDGFTPSRETALAAPRFPLDVAFCAECALVQIRHTVPPQVLFGDDYLYLSSFTDTVVRNARENTRARMEDENLGPDSLVVELASNDGYLLANYREAGIPVLGIDPAKRAVAAARARGIETLQMFFGLAEAEALAAEGRRADVIHANNVVAHVADTNGFVAGIAALLKDSGVAVIEFPYLRDLIDHCEFDTIYHEHLCYFSVTAAEALLSRHGLTLTRAERLPIHGGSLRLFARKTGARGPSVTALLEEERALGLDRLAYYADFASRVSGIRTALGALLKRLKSEGSRIAGYGAAAKGTILLNSVGADAALLDFVADRNTEKQGRWVPGAGLPIVPPERIAEERPDYLLILPWNHKEEIIAQQEGFRRRGGRFLLPIPEPKIVDGL